MRNTPGQNRRRPVWPQSALDMSISLRNKSDLVDFGNIGPHLPSPECEIALAGLSMCSRNMGAFLATHSFYGSGEKSIACRQTV